MQQQLAGELSPSPLRLSNLYKCILYLRPTCPWEATVGQAGTHVHQLSLGTASVGDPGRDMALLALRIKLSSFVYGFHCPLAKGHLYRGHRAPTVFQSGLRGQLSSVVPASIYALK